MKKLKNEKGFNLMELTVAAAIVGILAGLAIPTYSTIVDIALGVACKYNQKYLESLISFYLAENNQSFVASDISGLSETTIMLSGASSVDVSRSLYPLIRHTSPFECPSARYYKVGERLNGNYVTDGYVVACATDNARSQRSDGAYFALDAPHSWENRSWNHSRESKP